MHLLHMAHTSPHMPITYLTYMAYMPNMVSIFVSSIYLTITSEEEVAVGVFWYICKNVGSMHPCSTMFV